MLFLHDGKNAPQQTPDLTATSLPDGVVWVDLVNADAAEITFIERATSLHVPSFEELSEIENSSRLRFLRGTVFMSVPLVAHVQQGVPMATPVGVVLGHDLLITVRFAELNGFNAFASEFDSGEHPISAAGAFTGLMEALVDRAADILEIVGADLDRISQSIFRTDTNGTGEREAPARAHANLRSLLKRIGQNGDLLAKIRDSLLGLGRIAAYVETMVHDHFAPDLLTRIKAQRQDLVSLGDYNTQLGNKVQLLLDATMGFINIEQNNIIKVLTVVSVVGVPPTLVASMYGMNFHNMPELSWPFGYEWGLTLIIISALLPMWWFKQRGWI